MKIFIDTEFIESGPDKPIHLISLGAVAEDGQRFYGENLECPLEQANDWVRQNVLPHLGIDKINQRHGHDFDLYWVNGTIRELADHFESWVSVRCDMPRRADQPPSKPEFWGYYADYDWVVLCQMFGAMVDLPKGWPMYCRDIKQWSDDLGGLILPAQDTTEHNALDDALWNKTAWEFLESRSRENVILSAR